MKISNPYNFILPVQEEMFFGRTKDCDDIVQHIISFPGDSVAIVGGRRMGKTSLLEAIYRALEYLQSSEQIGLVPIPILIPLRGENFNSSREFFFHIGNETQYVLGRWLGRDFLNFSEIPEHSPPAPIIRRFLIEWSKLLAAQIGKHFRLIILLDECEQIVKQPWATNLYDALYYLLTGQSTRSLIKVVMAGSHHFLTQVQQNGSSLREILHYHKLQVLDKDAIDLLINIPTAATLPKEIIEKIENASGGHPYLIQYIMHNLCNSDLTHITVADVNSIISDFPLMRSSFSNWVGDLRESSSEIFYVISLAEEGLSESEIRTILINPPADLLQAIDALHYYGLISRGDSGKYRVSGRMFFDWFNTNMSSQFHKSYSNSNQKEDIKLEEDIFDVFLSHSHSDADLVETLAKQLEDIEGIKVWLDKWILVPGELWIQEIDKGISQAKACAIFLGVNTPSGWFKQEIERALNRQARDGTFRVIPVLLPGVDKGTVDNFLELRTWVDFKNGVDDKNAFRRLVAGIRRIPPGRDT